MPKAQTQQVTETLCISINSIISILPSYKQDKKHIDEISEQSLIIENLLSLSMSAMGIHREGNNSFFKQMAVAHSIFTLGGGGFNCFGQLLICP